MEYEFLGLESEQWLKIGIALLIMATALILGRWVFRVLLNRGARWIIRRTRTTFDDAVLDALQAPLYWLGVFIAVQIALGQLDFLPKSWVTGFEETFYLLYLAVGFIFAWQFVQNIFTWYGRDIAARAENNASEQWMPFFRRVAMIILGLIGIIMLLGHFDVDVSGFVATLGIGSVAIALAAQATLTDMISGFAIMIDRPFRIGDFVTAGGVSGSVESITIFNTVLNTPDNKRVVVPNGSITNNAITNANANSTRRIDLVIGISYKDDIKRAKDILADLIAEETRILKDPAPKIAVLELAESSVNLAVRPWVNTCDYWDVFFDLNEKIKVGLEKEGLTIPYPQQDIHIFGIKES